MDIRPRGPVFLPLPAFRRALSRRRAAHKTPDVSGKWEPFPAIVRQTDILSIRRYIVIKKLFALALSVALALCAVAVCETAQPETRETLVSIEGTEETIVETRFVSQSGYSLWYPADMFTCEEADGQARFVPVDGVEAMADVGMIVVPVDVAVEDADSLLGEATANYGAEAAVGEAVEWTNESGASVRSVEVAQEQRVDRFYLVTGGDSVFCVTATYLPEMTEGFGARMETMVRTMEIAAADEGAQSGATNIVEGDFTGFADDTTVEVLVEDGYKSYKVFDEAVKAYLESIDNGSAPIRFAVETVNGMEAIVAVPVE